MGGVGHIVPCAQEQPGEIGRLGGGVEGACRRTESANPASVPLQGMCQRLVAIGALLVEAVFEQMTSAPLATSSRRRPFVAFLR
eukprot:COSAG01_NODE_8525_length_2753_cov_3.025245_2_plen_84_part_00